MKINTYNCHQFENLKIEGDIPLNPFIMKGVLTVDESIKVIDELIFWRKDEKPYDSETLYPKNKLNLHKPVTFNPEVQEQETPYKTFPLDFKDNRTKINVHNFRIGDIYHPYIAKNLPTVKSCGKKIINLYRNVMNKKFYHGGEQSGPNLYLEFANYDYNCGHIDWHTHYRHIENGQDWNMLTLLTQNGIDHEKSGLQFLKDENVTDTTNILNQGDSIFFFMGTPHRVLNPEPTLAQKNQKGRWSLSLFYY